MDPTMGLLQQSQESGSWMNPLSWYSAVNDKKNKEAQLALSQNQWDFSKMINQYDLDMKKKKDQWKIDLMRAMANGNRPSSNVEYNMDSQVTETKLETPNKKTDSKYPLWAPLGLTINALKEIF